MNGGMILLPLPPYLPILPVLPIGVKYQSKTIVSVLILCKNYCYEYLLVEGFQ